MFSTSHSHGLHQYVDALKPLQKTLDIMDTEKISLHFDLMQAYKDEIGHFFSEEHMNSYALSVGRTKEGFDKFIEKEELICNEKLGVSREELGIALKERNWSVFGDRIPFDFDSLDNNNQDKEIKSILTNLDIFTKANQAIELVSFEEFAINISEGLYSKILASNSFEEMQKHLRYTDDKIKKEARFH